MNETANQKIEQASVRKNRLFFWAVVIAALNPIFSGLILGILFLREPDLKKEGRIVTLFSVVWGLIALGLIYKYRLTM
ncbi:hypothetical protein KGQ34_00370 [Patescibacteria group bacterium]|nr:hypothetical protein [Patescibacteria group bacterium]